MKLFFYIKYKYLHSFITLTTLHFNIPCLDFSNCDGVTAGTAGLGTKFDDCSLGDDKVEVTCVIVTGVCIVGEPVMSSTSSTKCYDMHYGCT